MPKVSIIITLYNINKQYLEECIDSLLSQKLQDFEILLIDDCSPISYEYLKKKSPKIKYYRNAINLGMCKSVNKLFKLACGKYLVRLGADDIFEDTLLLKESTFLDTHPDYIACCCELMSFGRTTRRILRDEEFDITTNLRAKNDRYGYAGGMMFRRDALDTCTIDENLKMCEDFDFHLQLLKRGKIHGIKEVLYHYRKHDTNATYLTSEKERLAYLDYIYKKHHVDTGLVSVLMPVYNVDPKLVAQCLRSISKSTYKRYEIILYNDGSVHTYKDSNEYKELRSSIIYAANKTNEGISSTLNKACKLAHGEYLVRIDADDLVEPTFIEEEVNFLNTHPDYIGCLCDLVQFGRKTGIITRPRVFNLATLRDIKSCRGYGYGCSLMFRHRALERCSFDPNLPVCEDFDFHIQLLRLGKIGSLPPLYRYRKHSSTIDKYDRDDRYGLITHILKKHKLA